MEIPLFLAMTAAEFRSAERLPAHIAWMACHFSAYGVGLSNVPGMLPRGSMLMLNDRTPICGHDPVLVAQTLCEAAQVLESDSILLDFQRSGQGELTEVVRAVLDRVECPVGVSALYAEGFDCPVLVPPIPLHMPPEKNLSVWKGRELWLELSTEGTEIVVTEEGSQYAPLSGLVPDEHTHKETELLCHYKITAEDERILFHLYRTLEDQAALVQAAETWGMTRALGLWQEKSLLQLQQAQEISD